MSDPFQNLYDKIRLRSCLTQDYLESLFLISSERELLINVTPYQVIN